MGTGNGKPEVAMSAVKCAARDTSLTFLRIRRQHLRWMSQISLHRRLQNSKTHILSFLIQIHRRALAINRKTILVERDIPPDVDAGSLTVTDTTAIDKESYECELFLPSFSLWC